MLSIPALGARGRRTPELRLIYKANSRTRRTTLRNSALRGKNGGRGGEWREREGGKAKPPVVMLMKEQALIQTDLLRRFTSCWYFGAEVRNVLRCRA